LFEPFAARGVESFAGKLCSRRDRRDGGAAVKSFLTVVRLRHLADLLLCTLNRWINGWKPSWAFWIITQQTCLSSSFRHLPQNVCSGDPIPRLIYKWYCNMGNYLKHP